MADLKEIADGLRVACTWVSGPRAAKLASYADQLDAHDAPQSTPGNVGRSNSGVPSLTEGDTGDAT